MKVYISSHDKELAKSAATQLRALGHDVTSMWHDEEGNALPPGDPRWHDRLRANLGRIHGSDALLLLSGPDKYPGGKFVETGAAFAWGVPVYVLGRYENGMTTAGTLIQSLSELPL